MMKATRRGFLAAIGLAPVAAMAEGKTIYMKGELGPNQGGDFTAVEYDGGISRHYSLDNYRKFTFRLAGHEEDLTDLIYADEPVEVKRGDG